MSVVAVVVTGMLLRVENLYMVALGCGLMLWPVVFCSTVFMFAKFQERAKARTAQRRGFGLTNRK